MKCSAKQSPVAATDAWSHGSQSRDQFHETFIRMNLGSGTKILIQNTLPGNIQRQNVLPIYYLLPKTSSVPNKEYKETNNGYETQLNYIHVERSVRSSWLICVNEGDC